MQCPPGCVGPPILGSTVGDVDLVFGEVCSSPHLARISAVRAAFECLEKKHFIKVLDYSSTVIDNYNHRMIFGQVNSYSDRVENMLNDRSSVLDGLQQFHSHLSTKKMAATTHGVVSATGKVYAGTEKFVGSVIKRYREKHRIIEHDWREYKDEKSRYLQDNEAKLRAYRLKVRLIS